MSETQDLTINYDFIKNVSSSTDINEAASILQKITFDIFIFCSGLVTEVLSIAFMMYEMKGQISATIVIAIFSDTSSDHSVKVEFLVILVSVWSSG